MDKEKRKSIYAMRYRLNEVVSLRNMLLEENKKALTIYRRAQTNLEKSESLMSMNNRSIKRYDSDIKQMKKQLKTN